jgi:hypothetical protein
MHLLFHGLLSHLLSCRLFQDPLLILTFIEVVFIVIGIRTYGSNNFLNNFKQFVFLIVTVVLVVYCRSHFKVYIRIFVSSVLQLHTFFLIDRLEY